MYVRVLQGNSIGMFGNNLLMLSFSTLTFFQFWFLKDGKVVFFLIIIFFIKSTIISSSSVNFFMFVFVGFFLYITWYYGAQSLGFYYFVFPFGLEFLAFQYLAFQLALSCLLDILFYLLVGIFHVPQDQKTNLSLVSFYLGQQVFSLY